MERQVPAGLSELYAEMDQKREEGRRKGEEARERGRLAKALYVKARTILEEYGNEEKVNKTIRLRTPSVAMLNGDKKLEFIMEGLKPSRSDIYYLPDEFRQVSVHEKILGSGVFNSSPLFLIREGDPGGEYGRLSGPLEVDAGRKTIETASAFLNIMEQSLSEAHTPRSQQIKPEVLKRDLSVLFRRLKFGFGKT